jgi:hypothetical protein
MSSLTDIQQAFVRRYMIDDCIVGVSVRRLDDESFVLDVELNPECEPIELPAEFEGLTVQAHSGRRAVLAFNYS